jgi:hypothetical protein
MDSEIQSARDERNNLWILQSAMRFGADKVEFICLWNGRGGDGPGGTTSYAGCPQDRGGHTGSTQRSSGAEVPSLCPRMSLLDSFRDSAVVDNVEDQGRRWR